MTNNRSGPLPVEPPDPRDIAHLPQRRAEAGPELRAFHVAPLDRRLGDAIAELAGDVEQLAVETPQGSGV